MSASTKVAGYPVHVVSKFVRWTNQYEARFTDWAARCGVHGSTSGHGSFGLAGSARKLELCSACFPGRDLHGAAPDEPEELFSLAELKADSGGLG